MEKCAATCLASDWCNSFTYNSTMGNGTCFTISESNDLTTLESSKYDRHYRCGRSSFILWAASQSALLISACVSSATTFACAALRCHAN